MPLQIEIAPRHHYPYSLLCDMHKLRAKVFHDRMGWEVPIICGMEIDGYDAFDPHYMMIREESGFLRGCWRLLPTNRPYMLKDTFPQLLHGITAPVDPLVWELSRFAIETGGREGFGFSDITIHSIGEVISYGVRSGLREYVTVTTTAIERLLRRSDVVTRRFGPPVRIGVENAVALYVDIEASFHRMRAHRPCATSCKPDPRTTSMAAITLWHSQTTSTPTL